MVTAYKHKVVMFSTVQGIVLHIRHPYALYTWGCVGAVECVSIQTTVEDSKFINNIKIFWQKNIFQQFGRGTGIHAVGVAILEKGHRQKPIFIPLLYTSAQHIPAFRNFFYLGFLYCSYTLGVQFTQLCTSKDLHINTWKTVALYIRYATPTLGATTSY